MDLDAIEQRVTAATEGPWHHDGRTLWGRDEHGRIKAETPADREFTQHARSDVPALVARVRELEAHNDLLQRQLDTAEGKRSGIWDTWEEHIARKEATPPEPPPKPALSLEEARKQAAECAARARDIAKED